MAIDAPSIAAGLSAEAVGASAAKVAGVAAISGAGNVLKGGDFATGLAQGALYAGAQTASIALVGSSPKPTFSDMASHTLHMAEALAGEPGSFAHTVALASSASVTAMAVGAHKPVKKPKPDSKAG